MTPPELRNLHGTVRIEIESGPAVLIQTDYKPGTKLKAHCHDVRYISVLLCGQYTEVVGTTPRLCHPGSVIVHEAGEVHADYFPTPGSIVNVVMDRDCPLRLAGELLEAWLRPRTWGGYGIVSALLAPSRSNQGPAPEWLNRIVQQVDWLQQSPLKRIAAAFGIHPTHLARSFRRHLGMTAVAYRQRERVRESSALLLNSMSPLTRIALSTGFADQSHFTNAFRATTGMSPAAYRRAFWR